MSSLGSLVELPTGDSRRAVTSTSQPPGARNGSPSLSFGEQGQAYTTSQGSHCAHAPLAWWMKQGRVSVRRPPRPSKVRDGQPRGPPRPQGLTPARAAVRPTHAQAAEPVANEGLRPHTLDQNIPQACAGRAASKFGEALPRLRRQNPPNQSELDCSEALRADRQTAVT